MPERSCKSATDLVFAEMGGYELLLDVSVPTDIDGSPLVMWIHGGGWRGGSHKANRISWIVEYGYATASIGASHCFGYSRQDIFGAIEPRPSDRFAEEENADLVVYNQDM